MWVLEATGPVVQEDRSVSGSEAEASGLTGTDGAEKEGHREETQEPPGAVAAHKTKPREGTTEGGLVGPTQSPQPRWSLE